MRYVNICVLGESFLWGRHLVVYEAKDDKNSTAICSFIVYVKSKKFWSITAFCVLVITQSYDASILKTLPYFM